MAHEIEIIDGKASMAWAGETPWHGLGTKVDPNLTPKQMLKAANLDWTVSKRDLFAVGEEAIRVPDHVALVRDSDNSIFSIISKEWEPVQNHTAFEFFTEFIEAGHMEMHTAGALHGGRMVWALAKVKESFSILKGKDKIESYLLFSNPHQYGKSIDIRLTPIRVVCNNTLTFSLGMKADTMMRLHHRQKFNAEAVKQTLGLASKKMTNYQKLAELMAKKNFTAEQVENYFHEVFPSSKEEKEGEEKKLSRPARLALSVLETQPGHELGAGTWWQAFNAVTFTVDHLLGHSDETRLASAWYGINRQRKADALQKASQMAMA